MSRVTVLFVLATTLTVLTVVASGQAASDPNFTIVQGSCSRKFNICESGSMFSVSSASETNLPTYTNDQQLLLNEEFNITCTVSGDNNDNKFQCRPQFDDSIPAGEYEMSLPLPNNASVRIPAGYILYRPRYFYGTQQVWRAPGSSPNPRFSAGGAANFTVSDGDTWTVYGNFNASATYNVTFYDTEDKSNESDPFGTPTCDQVSVTQQALTCTVHAKAGMEGKYKYLVQDVATGGYLRGSTVQELLVIVPPLPTVTSVTGDCATKSSACATGAVLSFTGSNFNARAAEDNVITVGDAAAINNNIMCQVSNSTEHVLTCTLHVDSNTAPGAYPVYAQVVVSGDRQVSPKALMGYLVLHGKAEDKGWMTAEPSLSLSTIEAMAPSVLKDGDNLTITGAFDTTQKYQVAFSQDALPYSADDTFSASCNINSISATRIVCTYKSGEYTKDARYALVYDASHAYYLAMDRTKLDPIELHPALPVVQAAGGDCAKSSEACRNGATLTLSGTGFNPTSTAANRVTLVGLSDSSCDVVAVSTNSITCQLKIRSDDSGIYPIQVQTRIAADEWSAPIAAGSIVLNGGAGVAGWGTGAVPFTISGGKSTNNIAALACSVVFGVLFLIVAVALIVICCRYTFVRRGARNAQEPFWNATDTNHGNRHEMPSTSKGESQH